jgi:hypothetical protein
LAIPGGEEEAPVSTPAPLSQAAALLRLKSRARGRRLGRADDPPAALLPEQRLLLLDTWRRSGLPARDFAALVGMPHRPRRVSHDPQEAFARHGPLDSFIGAAFCPILNSPRSEASALSTALQLLVVAVVVNVASTGKGPGGGHTRSDTRTLSRSAYALWSRDT